MFSYQLFYNKIKKYSEEKLGPVVFANWFGNTILLFVIFLLLNDFFLMLFMVSKIIIFKFLGDIAFVILLFYLCTRKAGVGLTKNRLVFVKFRHFGYRAKRTFEIPFDLIRSISVNKFLNLRIVKVSFISDIGKLEKIKFYFNSFILGFNMSEYKKSSEEIYNKLKEMQKVLDKGDF